MAQQMKKAMLFMAMTLVSFIMQAQVKKVSGTYTYYGDPNMSVKEVRVAAIENARVQALAKEFGTIITQSTLQQEDLKNGNEHSSFMLLNAAEVKGEWLEDLKKPEILREEFVKGMLVVEAQVYGRARAISNDAIEFKTLTLRNGTEKRFADTNFKEGDDMFLYFQAPADGYVAVYLVDELQNVFCLLPYGGDNDGQQPVEHGKEYVFFSPQHQYDIPKSEIDEVTMTCEDERFEHNQLYVIYSPNTFTKPVDQKGKQINRDLVLPRQLSFKDFSQWMSKCCARDKKMNRKVIHLTVNKKS
jgi:hypothetical protein